MGKWSRKRRAKHLSKKLADELAAVDGLVKCCRLDLCDDESCEHRLPHGVFQEEDSDGGLACTSWIKCSALTYPKEARCRPISEIELEMFKAAKGEL